MKQFLKNHIGKCIALLSFVLFWHNFFDLRRIVTRTYRISSAKIKKPYRFLVIADLHGSTYGKKNQKLIVKIKKKNPNGILLVGDILSKESKKKQQRAVEFLKELAKNYPVYYAFGNHESVLFSPEFFFSEGNKKKQSFFHNLSCENLHLLQNESLCILESLRREGVEKKPSKDSPAEQSDLEAVSDIKIHGLELPKAYYHKFHPKRLGKGKLDELLGTCDHKAYQILLAHHPDHFAAYADWGADLVLSGHNHGGIVKLPFLGGVISTGMRPFPKHDGGIFQEKATTMIVSRGLGTHGFPLRLFNPPELVELVLLPEKS